MSDGGWMTKRERQRLATITRKGKSTKQPAALRKASERAHKIVDGVFRRGAGYARDELGALVRKTQEAVDFARLALTREPNAERREKLHGEIAGLLEAKAEHYRRAVDDDAPLVALGRAAESILRAGVLIRRDLIPGAGELTDDDALIANLTACRRAGSFETIARDFFGGRVTGERLRQRYKAAVLRCPALVGTRPVRPPPVAKDDADENDVAAVVFRPAQDRVSHDARIRHEGIPETTKPRRFGAGAKPSRK